jgi:hypothetical protein
MPTSEYPLGMSIEDARWTLAVGWFSRGFLRDHGGLVKPLYRGVRNSDLLAAFNIDMDPPQGVNAERAISAAVRALLTEEELVLLALAGINLDPPW